VIVIGGFAVELLERIFLDGERTVAKGLKCLAHPLTGLPFTTDSDDAGSEGARADVAEGIFTAIGASDDGVGECAVELVDSISAGRTGVVADHDARNLRMLVISTGIMGRI